MHCCAFEQRNQGDQVEPIVFERPAERTGITPTKPLLPRFGNFGAGQVIDPLHAEPLTFERLQSRIRPMFEPVASCPRKKIGMGSRQRGIGEAMHAESGA